jgi:predicted transcriptional regulator YdeE
MKKTIVIALTTIASLLITGGIIMSFLLNKIDNVEPEIVALQEPIEFVGMSVNTDVKKIYRDAAKLGKAYTQFKKTNDIPNLKDQWSFVAYSRGFNEETRSWEYIMGDVVKNLDSIPEGLNGYKISAGKYAIFKIKAKFRLLWGLEIARMKKYVFEEWLPNSQYDSDGTDFEYHDKRSTGKNPSIDLYIGIQEKH